MKDMQDYQIRVATPTSPVVAITPTQADTATTPASRTQAMEKEGIAGSGIMNGINDGNEKSIGNGIEPQRFCEPVLP